MRWSRTTAAALLMLACLSQAPANIAPPQPAPPKPDGWATLVVEIDPDAKDARLVVPRKIVVRKAELDVPGEDRLTDAIPEQGRGWPRTVMAGVSLALALSCAGVWLARRGKMNGTRLGLLLALGILAGGGVAWADIGLPGRRPRPVPRPQPPALQQLYSGKVAVEYVAEGDSIKLILPPDAVKKLGRPGDKPAAAPEAIPQPKPNQPEKPA